MFWLSNFGEREIAKKFNKTTNYFIYKTCYIILYVTCYICYNISIAESIVISNSHFIASLLNIPGLLRSRYYIFLIQGQYAKHF